ncbi:MAG TPA: hypothetical protein VLS96_18130, partial [Nodosilinea sp.]|nr:hypothetical protein [Nodosilinea sp.]
VALPDNDHTDYALQPWASYFDPQRNLRATPTPADEAFFAACGGRPAQRLQLQIQSPPTGTIPPTWDGKLSFSNASNVGGWKIQLRLVVDQLQTFSYPDYESPEPPEKIDFDLTGDNISSRLQDALASRAAGDVVQVVARVKPFAATDNFWQTLTFPLRVIDPEALPLPLRPTFIQFEDPEYNRQLVSNAATATVSVLEQRASLNVIYDITLACDRREYNPQGTLLLRYDWSDNRPDSKGTISVSRVNTAGIVRPLRWPLDNGLSAEQKDKILSRNLIPLSLVDLQTVNKITLSQGDVLELTLTLTVNGQSEPSTIVLPVRIVNSPVIPAPQAAYGLLRGMVQSPEGGQGEGAIAPSPPAGIECTRFAWGPAASRIELICAEDLRTGIVRRRAVFQWSDTVRPSPNPGWQYQYAVQKITQTGSTHLPRLVPISDLTAHP